MKEGEAGKLLNHTIGCVLTACSFEPGVEGHRNDDLCLVETGKK
jgi:hypothetical protein